MIIITPEIVYSIPTLTFTLITLKHGTINYTNTAIPAATTIIVAIMSITLVRVKTPERN
jgi:hypothetical protein